jgi:hypothetical protein
VELGVDLAAQDWMADTVAKVEGPNEHDVNKRGYLFHHL